MADANDPVAVNQLRVRLREISPMIWRRLLVRSDSTIADLHYALQIAMGWTDTHLNRFVIYGKEYGVAKIGGAWFSDDPRQVMLSHLHLRLKEPFLNEYDFGDRWQHEVRLEKVIPMDRRKTYPLCIGGARKAPPEDCGGPWAFMALEQHYSAWYIAERLLEIMEEGRQNERRGEVCEFLYWLSVDRFNRRVANRRLKQYANGDEPWLWTGEEEPR
jgi:hypothetical protein